MSGTCRTCGPLLKSSQPATESTSSVPVPIKLPFEADAEDVLGSAYSVLTGIGAPLKPPPPTMALLKPPTVIRGQKYMKAGAPSTHRMTAVTASGRILLPPDLRW